MTRLNIMQNLRLSFIGKIFNTMNIFGRQAEEILESWSELASVDQFEKLLLKSYERTQIIFKHSVRCGISWGAKYRLEKGWDMTDAFDFYYLDIFANRPVSNAIAEQLGVVHQSPQLIVIKEGAYIEKVSHHNIDYGWLEQFKN